MAYLAGNRAAAGRSNGIGQDKAPLRRRMAGPAGLVAFALGFCGLVFGLAYAAVEDPAVAIVLTLLILLPAVSLAAAPSASGPMRR